MMRRLITLLALLLLAACGSDPVGPRHSPNQEPLDVAPSIPTRPVTP